METVPTALFGAMRCTLHIIIYIYMVSYICEVPTGEHDKDEISGSEIGNTRATHGANEMLFGCYRLPQPVCIVCVCIVLLIT